MSLEPTPPRLPPASRWAVFVRAARPAANWLMVLGLALQVIILPVAALFVPAAAALVNVDVARLLAEGVLGLGAFRTIDKLVGKAT
jgi:hypothetical protein